MNQDEQDLQNDLRLMAYLDRQLPAEEALRLEADLAKDANLAARFTALKKSFSGLDRLMDGFNRTVESQTPPDWSASLAGAMEKMQSLEAPLAGIDGNPAGTDAPSVRSSTGRSKVIPVPRHRWMHSVAAISAVAAAALLMVFVLQEVPFLPLEPQAAPLNPYALPAQLPVTINPARTRPVQATAQEITPEQLQALGLSQAQAEQFLRDGVVILSHNELPAWQGAGLESQLVVGDKALPTYLTADAVYNQFLAQMADAAEAFDRNQNTQWGALCGASREKLRQLQHPNHPTHAGPGPDALFQNQGGGLAALLETAERLAKQDYLSSASPETEEELQRVRKAPDQTYSEMLGRKVDYAWIRQNPSSMVRRWLSFVTTTTENADDAKRMTHSLKLWWTVLQKDPALWAQYCTLAGHSRYEEAGTATALDLIDLHDDFVKICGEDPKQRFDRLMRADLTTYKKPLGILPERTPFRDQLAVAMQARHSYLDGVIANPDVDRSMFVALRQRADAVDAYLNTQRPDDALPRWNRIFSPVAKPAAAWPYQTAAWQEKNHRLMASAWVGTPVRPRVALPEAQVAAAVLFHYDSFEAAPDFYNHLRALCAERASTLPKEDAVAIKLGLLAKWLEKLTAMSLDQLAGRPQNGIDLAPSLYPAPAGPTRPESVCRVALFIESAEAGNTDLLMGNGALAHILILQRDKAGAVRIHVGAVSNPREGLAPHSADPQSAWAKLAQDGVLNGFHYNSR